MTRGEIWRVDFGLAFGSITLDRRPAVIVQNNNFNASKIATTIVIPLTTNTLLAEYKDNIREQLFLGGCPLPARSPHGDFMIPPSAAS